LVQIQCGGWRRKEEEEEEEERKRERERRIVSVRVSKGFLMT